MNLPLTVSALDRIESALADLRPDDDYSCYGRYIHAAALSRRIVDGTPGEALAALRALGTMPIPVFQPPRMRCPATVEPLLKQRCAASHLVKEDVSLINRSDEGIPGAGGSAPSRILLGELWNYANRKSRIAFTTCKSAGQVYRETGANSYRIYLNGRYAVLVGAVPLDLKLLDTAAERASEAGK